MSDAFVRDAIGCGYFIIIIYMVTVVNPLKMHEEKLCNHVYLGLPICTWRECPFVLHVESHSTC